MKKKSFITVTDMFCGAGGSSQGIRRIANRNNGGIEVSLAMNHWKLAIKTHEANFPDTDHECSDISAADPRRYNSTDLLIASPECTNHSLAKNKKHVKKQFNLFETQQQEEDRSRATMWDVPRFAEYHQYNCIVTENVIDAKRWIMYDAWLKAMELLGYAYKECYLNSMHFPPTPQSRDRLYVVFWKKKNKAPKLEYKPLAYCVKCEKDIHAYQWWKPDCLPYGKYRTQYLYKCSCGETVEPYYFAAMNCIDWTIKSERVGDKKPKLCANTIERIRLGKKRFWDGPFVMYGGDNSNIRKGKKVNDRSYALTDVMRTQCAQPWHQLITPFLARNTNPGHSAKVDEAIGTQIGNVQHTLISPPLPFMVDYYGNSDETSAIGGMPAQTGRLKHGVIYPPFITQSSYGGRIIGADEPWNVQTGQQNFDLVQLPFQVELNSTGTARSLSDAINTQMACAKHNAIITSEAWQAFIGHYYGTGTTKGFSVDNKIEVEDCYYRMIKAKEVGKAMAFDDSYIVYGDERQQVKQYGNAVTPPVMEWLANQCVESLK